VELTSSSLTRTWSFLKNNLDERALMWAIMGMSRAYRESERRSDFQKTRWKTKRLVARTQPISAVCPAWLKPIKVPTENNKFKTVGFEVIKDRGKLVQKLFKDAADGIGIYVQVKRLNEAKIPSFGRSGKWTLQYVAAILANRAVLGEHQPHRIIKEGRIKKRVAEGDPIADYFPRVISDELFHRVRHATIQRLTRGRGRKGDRLNNLFSGIAYCVYCKSKMRYLDIRQRYLVCDGATRGFGCKITKGWRYDDFEASFLEFVEELDLGSIINEEEHEAARLKVVHEIESCRGQVTSLDQEIDEKLQLRLDTAIARERVGKRLDELGRQLAELKTTINQKEHQLHALKIQPMNIEELKAIISKVQGNGNDAYQLRAQIAARLKSLVDAIYIAAAGSEPLRDNTIEVDDEFDIRKIAPNDPRMTRRWFSVKFANENRFLLLGPDSDNPRRLTKTGFIAPLMVWDDKD
jgi:hypothetical protein